MKVLFAASEAVPFIKTGGLGDVAGALPKALCEKGVDARVILPLYQDIPEKWKSQMNFLKVVWVPLAWRTQYCGVFSLEYEGVTYYFLDNKYYFGRRGLYGYFDDAERYAFFCKAVLEILQHLDFEPDVIHCNDWQTALIPVFLEEFYRKDVPCCQNLRVLFTIHNIQYQGIFPPDITEYVMGMSKENYDNGWLQFDGMVNLMKAAIVSSSWITTVSPTYAQEIQYEYYGHGMQWMLRNEREKLSGILNGIDYTVYDPKTDSHLFANYSARGPKKKEINKAKLQEMLSLPVRPEVPMIAMISRLVEHKGLDLVKYDLEQILEDDVQLVILGTGDYQYEEMFKEAQRKYPSKVSANITFNLDLAQKIYAGADIFLMPSQSEPCGLSQMIAMRYGTIPVVRETGGLKDTVQPYWEGTGTGFTFTNYNADDMLYVLREAESLYQDKVSWKKLMKDAMNKDFSWNLPAKEYIALYEKISGKE